MINELQVYWNWFLGPQNDGYGFEVRKCVLSVNSHKTKTMSISSSSLARPLLPGLSPPLPRDTALFIFFKLPTHSFSSGSSIFESSLTHTAFSPLQRANLWSYVLNPHRCPELQDWSLNSARKYLQQGKLNIAENPSLLSLLFLQLWSVSWPVVFTESFFIFLTLYFPLFLSS